MWKIVRREVRPDSTIEFTSSSVPNQWTDEFKRYFNQTYEKTGKLISSEKTMIDEFTRETVMLWDCVESMQEFMSDPQVWENIVKSNKDYNNFNKIKNDIIFAENVPDISDK